MENLKALFAHWDSPMVGACLQGHMGRVLPLGQSSALASIGDFCFLAGEPSPELVEQAVKRFGERIAVGSRRTSDKTG